MSIADNLKVFMDNKKFEGFSATDIAKKLGISKSTLSNYINGDAYIPLKYLNQLANMFDVSFDYLLGLCFQMQYPNSKAIKTLDAKIIGENLLRFRKESKMNQALFAESIGTNKASVSRYENGINLILTIQLYSIAKKYKVSIDYLLGKIDSPKYLK